jgi:hypothetical protein
MEERFLAEFILSLVEGLGMTAMYRICHLEPFALTQGKLCERY